MNICSDFNPISGLKNYCSLSCRNTRNHSLDTKRKISDGMKNSYKINGKKLYANEIYLKINETRQKNILNRISSFIRRMFT